jgi:membrane protease YdiL (CAAX protease family)
VTLVTLLAVEFLILFVIGPTIFAFTRHRIPAIPALWAVLAYCLFVLLHDPQFDRRHLWDTSSFCQHLPAILALFALCLAIGIVLILRYAPADFLSLPRSRPALWSIIMVLYPVLSVYPQGVVYRVFLFHRYRGQFGGDWGIVLASALAFAYVHIIFRNALAVILTFLGGLLFAFRYLQTGSLPTSSFEHALYGCAIFTIGLGASFYHWAVLQRT